MQVRSSGKGCTCGRSMGRSAWWREETATPANQPVRPHTLHLLAASCAPNAHVCSPIKAQAHALIQGPVTHPVPKVCGGLLEREVLGHVVSRALILVQGVANGHNTPGVVEAGCVVGVSRLDDRPRHHAHSRSLCRGRGNRAQGSGTAMHAGQALCPGQPCCSGQVMTHVSDHAD
jgi:hypothetical protein